MNDKGIANTYALQGGTQGWKNAGYPMDGSVPQVPIDKSSGPNPPNPTSPQNY